MKACILAGGEGTRLRPLTSRRPKPMVKLFDRPVMEYILGHLKDNGVDLFAVTLMYLPGVITDYFGESYKGIPLISRTEDKPLGTAGGVAAFRDILSDDDFIVVSGDAVFDFDLVRAMAFHKEKSADATVLLCRHTNPTEYGLVLRDKDSRVTEFIEKPPWEQVLTDCVNTGIYILSPKVFDLIPNNTKFDFSRDLFPLLVKRESIFGYEASGYWRDIGNSEAYLKAANDALSGRIKLSPSIDFTAYQKPDPSVRIIPPVYISPDAKISSDCLIGPYVSLNKGAFLGKGCDISYSSISADIGCSSEIKGAIIDGGAKIGSGSAILNGVVVGEGVQLGKGCYIGRNVKIPVGTVIQDGVFIDSERELNEFANSRKTVVSSGIVHDPSLGDCMKLAAACRSCLGRRAASGASFEGEEESGKLRSLYEGFNAALISCGTRLYRHDAGFAASAAFAGRLLHCDFSVWFAYDSDMIPYITIFGSDGITLSRDLSRKLGASCSEQILESGDGSANDIRGIDSIFSCELTRSKKLKSTVFCEDTRLRRILSDAGVTFSPKREGSIAMSSDKDGFKLSLCDEKGKCYTSDEVELLVLLAEYSLGADVASLRSSAPSACDILAEKLGKKLYRYSDGEPSSLHNSDMHHYRNAAEAALLLLTALEKFGKRLYSFASEIPSCATITRDYIIGSSGLGRASLMAQLGELYKEDICEKLDGIKLKRSGGYISFSPSAFGNIISIRAEGMNSEAASELCDFLYDELESLDKDSSSIAGMTDFDSILPPDNLR